MRMTFIVGVSLFVAVAVNHAAAQTAPAWLAEKSQFMDSTREQVCPEDGDLLECGNGWRAAAEARLAADQPWSSDLFQEAAMAYLRGGSKADALITYQRLEEVAEAPTWSAYAAFRVGELLLESGDATGALAAAQRSLETIGVGGPQSDLGLYARVCLMEAKALRGLDRRAEAVLARARLLGQPWTAFLSSEHAGAAWVESARDYFELGDVVTGQAYFDAFFAAYPELGATDGRRVLWQIERAIAGRQLADASDEVTVEELLSIWSSPTWVGFPEIMVCASNLGTMLAVNNDLERQIELLQTARADFDANESNWQNLSATRLEIAREMFESITIDYIDILRRRGEWDEVVAVASDLIQRFPDTPFLEIALDAIKEGMEKR